MKKGQQNNGRAAGRCRKVQEGGVIQVKARKAKRAGHAGFISLIKDWVFYLKWNSFKLGGSHNWFYKGLK